MLFILINVSRGSAGHIFMIKFMTSATPPSGCTSHVLAINKDVCGRLQIVSKLAFIATVQHCNSTASLKFYELTKKASQMWPAIVTSLPDVER